MSGRISGGKDRGRRLRSPKGAGLRPTSARVRGAVFSIVGLSAVEGARVLDLYAGTGVLGIEALSRGAVQADFVEADDRRCQHIREALRQLDMAERARVYKARAIKALDILQGGYDLVFADPPYQEDPWGQLLPRLGQGALLTPGARVVAEHRKDLVLEDSYGRLRVESRRRYGDSAITIFRAEGGHG